MRKWKYREVWSLAQVTQLIRGGAGIEPRLPSSRDHDASERKMPCYHHFAGRDLEPRGFEFLLMISQPEMDLNLEPVSFPSQAWG